MAWSSPGRGAIHALCQGDVMFQQSFAASRSSHAYVPVLSQRQPQPLLDAAQQQTNKLSVLNTASPLVSWDASAGESEAEFLIGMGRRANSSAVAAQVADGEGAERHLVAGQAPASSNDAVRGHPVYGSRCYQPTPAAGGHYAQAGGVRWPMADPAIGSPQREWLVGRQVLMAEMVPPPPAEVQASREVVSERSPESQLGVAQHEVTQAESRLFPERGFGGLLSRLASNGSVEMANHQVSASSLSSGDGFNAMPEFLAPASLDGPVGGLLDVEPGAAAARAESNRFLGAPLVRNNVPAAESHVDPPAVSLKVETGMSYAEVTQRVKAGTTAPEGLKLEKRKSVPNGRGSGEGQYRRGRGRERGDNDGSNHRSAGREHHRQQSGHSGEYNRQQSGHGGGSRGGGGRGPRGRGQRGRGRDFGERSGQRREERRHGGRHSG